MSAPMSPGYAVPYDFFSPQPSPPRTGGYEVTEFPPREEYAVEIFDAPRKRVTSMSERTTEKLRAIAPDRYRDSEFITKTDYYVAGDPRSSFQLRSWDGRKYLTRFVSAVYARDFARENPGSVVGMEPKRYSISGGFDRFGEKLPRKTDPGAIELHSRARVDAPLASMIPTKEFKFIANEHNVPPKVVASIIRDVDALAFNELDAAEHGRLRERRSTYGVVPMRRYALGSERDIAAKETAKRKRAALKGEYGSIKRYNKKKAKAMDFTFY